VWEFVVWEDQLGWKSLDRFQGGNLLLIERHGTAYNEIYVIDLIDKIRMVLGMDLPSGSKVFVNLR
jgi:hypothetical protein